MNLSMPSLLDHQWVDRSIDRAPRLGVLALLVMAWALTLAWPPPPSGARPLVAGMSKAQLLAGYPLRLTLPQSAQAISGEELSELAQRHESIAELRIDQWLPSSGSTDQQQSFVHAVRSDFAAAFAAFSGGDGGNAARPASTPGDSSATIGPAGLMQVDYDLATLKPTEVSAGSYNGEDGSLTVTKRLLVDGKNSGDATIRIEEGAQIYIATSSVAKALAGHTESLPRRIAGAIESGSGFIPFHELRGAGIAVEYDPVTDRVSLSTPS